MPEYLMGCPNGHRTRVWDSMLSEEHIYCPFCDALMWRIPQAVNINWNGLRPSQGEISGEIKDQIENQDRYRAEFEQMHEEHEKATGGIQK